MYRYLESLILHRQNLTKSLLFKDKPLGLSVESHDNCFHCKFNDHISANTQVLLNNVFFETHHEIVMVYIFQNTLFVPINRTEPRYVLEYFKGNLDDSLQKYILASSPLSILKCSSVLLFIQMNYRIMTHDTIFHLK